MVAPGLAIHTRVVGVTMAHPFLERLRHDPLVADGAMGTQLFARGIRADRCLDEINLSKPELVQQIHREYIAAGAELIETNTFGASRFRLAPFGLADRVGDINRQAARLAREARDIMGETVFIAGAVGPSGALFQPLGPVAYAETASAVQEQVEALVEKGVDLLIFETFTDLNELTVAVAAAQRVCDLPIVAEMSFDDTRRTASGHDVLHVVEALERLQVPVVGVNCGIGPQQALDLVGQLGHATRRLVSAMPNAGYPVRVGGRISYLATPTYFADFARTAVATGAHLVGGCCGTSPDHIRAMRDALRDVAPRAAVVVPPRSPPAPAPASADQSPTTRLAAKLANRQFVISVELDPPRGSNPTKALKGAALLREAGVDVINIGDNVMAKVRMSCLGLALLIQQHVGLETLVHFSPRDRNLMAVQSDLLGAHALGIRHVLAVTGDQLRASTNPPVTAVWDVDSIGLIGILQRLNQGIDYTGTSIGRPTSFLIGCSVGPNGPRDLDQELDRLRQKLDAGAEFVMTQPLFTIEQLDRFLDRVGGVPVPLILGVVPLESYRQAELLHHEIPGFSVPDEVRERMRQAGDRGAEEGLLLADEFVEQARSRVSGVYIMTSYGRYDAAIALTRKLAALSRGEARA
ncbi:MAG TPA: bifunctional homocysteine S-methyltransferase/methylenetetrahydrofolate reductase [Chloroflexota bacterium]|nr:bifunctional homocysteine S-methyltransferase/methylenetetrahydrofolate reductase [Chloroflexota bacterium]